MEMKTRKMMPLVSASYKPGIALEHIKALEDPEEREMAFADHYQYSGDPQRAVEIAKEYLDHKDMALKLSAHIICFISGLAIGDAGLARKTFVLLRK